MNGQIVNQLKQLSSDDLRDKLENYIYQPLRLKLITKKDHEGRIRHNAGQLYELNEEKGAKESISMINEMLGRM